MIFSSYITTLFLSANLLLANSHIGRMDACDEFPSGGPLQPAQTSRTLELEGLGIKADIPQNFRAMARAGGSVLVLPPDDFSYFQCSIENRVPTAPDIRDVLLYRSEPASEALIRSQSEDRFGTTFIREDVIAGQQAFFYTKGGMTNDLVVRINYPDQEASLIVSAEILADGQVPMQEAMDRVLDSLSFL